METEDRPLRPLPSRPLAPAPEPARTLAVTLWVVTASLFLENAAAKEPLSRKSYRVAMRDGVELATDVYVPAAADEPLPALLVRTPYGRRRYEAEDPEIRLHTGPERSSRLVLSSRPSR